MGSARVVAPISAVDFAMAAPPMPAGRFVGRAAANVTSQGALPSHLSRIGFTVRPSSCVRERLLEMPRSIAATAERPCVEVYGARCRPRAATCSEPAMDLTLKLGSAERGRRCTYGHAACSADHSEFTLVFASAA